MQKQIILAAILCCSVHNTQPINTSTTFEQGIKYLEYNLVTKPNNRLSTENKHFAAGITLATAVYATSKIKFEDGFTIDVQPKDMLKLGFVAGIASAVYHKFVSCFRKRSIHTKYLVDFVANWAQHKEYTPKHFYELFNALAELHATKGVDAVKACAQDVMEVLLYHLSHEFASRYSNKSSDTVNTIKALSDTAKNIKEIIRA